jgi:hypothetical protein
MEILNRTNLESALLIRIKIAKYQTTPSGPLVPYDLLISDSLIPITITAGAETLNFVPGGQFLSITSTRSELRASTSQVSITISGIPDNNLSEIINSKIKYSPVEIRRALIDPTTGIPLAETGNVIGRFFGIVSNISIDENWGSNGNDNSVTFICSSKQEIFSNNVSGRRTNGLDERLHFPNDASFDNVATLVGSNFNFGIPNSVEYTYTKGGTV